MQITSKILLLEDDLTLAYFIKRKLENSGQMVDVVNNGRVGEKQAMNSYYDLILLDIGLPEVSGLKILDKIRTKNVDTPIIIITNDSSDQNELKSYNKGANLFHKKPLDFPLLEAQVNTMLVLHNSPKKIELGDLILEPKKRFVIKGGREIKLSYKEFELLLLLVKAEGEVLDRREILNRTFKGTKESEEGSVDTLVSRMRKKLGPYKGEQVIETVHSKGFRLNLKYWLDSNGSGR